MLLQVAYKPETSHVPRHISKAIRTRDAGLRYLDGRMRYRSRIRWRFSSSLNLSRPDVTMTIPRNHLADSARCAKQYAPFHVICQEYSTL